MHPIVIVFIGCALGVAACLVIGLLNVYRYFRCPDCGRLSQEGYWTMALLPFGLVIPGLLVPLIGPPAVIVIMALKPGWLLNADVDCLRCTEVGYPPEAAGAVAAA